MHLSARAMSSNMLTRWALWLRSWSGEAGYRSKLVNLPFKDGKLFSKALEPILVEANNKRKVLPLGKKEFPKTRQPSFHPFRQRFRDSSGPQFKSCWTNARVLPRAKPNNNYNNFLVNPARALCRAQRYWGAPPWVCSLLAGIYIRCLGSKDSFARIHH